MSKPLDVIVCGVPQYLGRARDYRAIFSQLSEAGVTAFCPDSQYVQIPEAKSLGWEVDFLLPGSADRPAYAELRKSGVKLIIPAEVIYPRDRSLPPIESDPLKGLIKQVGRKYIYAMLSYDEPSTTGVSVARVRELYQRVKRVDPTLPVMLVHAPIPEAPYRGITDPSRIADFHLKNVVEYHPYADMLGFTLYTIPEHVAKLATPFSRGKVSDNFRTIIGDYTSWLRQTVPDKSVFAVMQAFSYQDQGFSALEAMWFKVRKPTKTELREMVSSAKVAGADSIVWWGPGLLDKKDERFWTDVLNAARQ